MDLRHHSLGLRGLGAGRVWAIGTGITHFLVRSEENVTHSTLSSLTRHIQYSPKPCNISKEELWVGAAGRKERGEISSRLFYFRSTGLPEILRGGWLISSMSLITPHFPLYTSSQSLDSILSCLGPAPLHLATSVSWPFSLYIY